MTGEEILNMPDAPVGERFCDVPISPEDRQWLADFLKVRRLLHDATAQLVPSYDYKPNWLRRALEVCNATGLQPDQFNRLTPAGEVWVVREAAAMSEQKRGELREMFREAVKRTWPCVAVVWWRPFGCVVNPLDWTVIQRARPIALRRREDRQFHQHDWSAGLGKFLDRSGV